MLRSILAVVAGSVTWMVTALGVDAVLISLGWFAPGRRVESVPLLLFSMSYALGFSVLAGYVTALVARRREVLHAFALALLQLTMAVVATVKFWDDAPVWYHVTLLALLVPATVLGGRLRRSQKSGAAGRRTMAAA